MNNEEDPQGESILRISPMICVNGMEVQERQRKKAGLWCVLEKLLSPHQCQLLNSILARDWKQTLKQRMDTEIMVHL